MPNSTQCTMCVKPTAQRCKGCGCSRYCSRKCQKDDWPVHKLLCSQLANFSAPPQASFKRAILFPEMSETELSMAPEFIWIPSRFHLGAGTDPRSNKVFFEHIAELSLRGLASLDRDNLRTRALSAEILVLDNKNTNFSDNRCVRALTAGADAFVGKGPVIAVKLAGSEGYADMDTVDLRTVVDLFNFPPTPGEPSIGALVPQFHDRRRIPAVRINCPGDIKASARAKFEVISVPQHHAVTRAPVAEISNRVGFPIRVIRCSGNETLYMPHLHIDKDSFDPTNQAATFLQMGTDPDSTGLPSWGFVPFDWMDPAGSVVVVRKDLQYLHPEHLEALCYYCRYVLQPLFDDSLGGGRHPDRPTEKRKVLERMTPREFENFYDGWAAAKKESDSDWGPRGVWSFVLD